ncbi:aspartate aminotransferase family protein [Acuticoccus sediminis]|uniref:aspartate aminotransferase family protein n=1 Tax=Acuticoccus sediminis TaxID=2184697 RepID=UPI001CFD9EBD|nr:aspartate aminotransferase family protein [Acuticoccus sediminis]
MSDILHRVLSGERSTAVAGDGNMLIMADGRRLLDACGGAAVSCLGHSADAVRQAIRDQVDHLAFAHTGAFTSDPAEALATRLVSRAPEGTGAGKAMFVGSGSEAMEAALKLARQYHVERGEPDRARFISRRGSYHGNTLGALAVGGHAGRRAPYAPMLMDVGQIDPCYAYRLREPGESEAEFARRMADQLDTAIVAMGAGTVAAFIAEPVVGATLGTVAAAEGYFRRIREICDRHGVLFIADEVMCGMGRTGTLFALEQEGVHADIVTIAKGLGAGYMPIAGVIASEGVVGAIAKGSGRLWNGHTYMGHALATAAALAVLDTIEKEELLSNVGRMGERLRTRLVERFDNHPHVGDIRGRGLFWSIELVADRDGAVTFDPGLAVAPRTAAEAMARGVMFYPGQGSADGVNGDHVLIAPSYTSTEEEIDRIAFTLGEAVDVAIGGAHG